MAEGPLSIRAERNKNEVSPPHHVVPGGTAAGGWASYLSTWIPSAPAEQAPLTGREDEDITGFRNPWPSFHKPTKEEMWAALEWGEDKDPSIELATSHLPDSLARSRAQQAAQLLHIEKPDFSFDSKTSRAKSTWLGHAGVLVQLPSLVPGGDPVRVIFDPIFSSRCSPSQLVGPIRSYKPPCKIEDLPAIDILLISHNHYDHLDYETIMAIWQINKARMRFIVPLKNLKWFVESGIPEDRVTELDWWESAYLNVPREDSRSLKVTCTPAQHSSIRDGANADSSLWAGWYLEHTLPGGAPYRVFFAGDTGYQFHTPGWPPSPPPKTSIRADGSGIIKSETAGSKGSHEPYPPCPAFTEIMSRLGEPNLLFLPVALGATWAYFRSFFASNYLPDYTNPFPRHSAGVTGPIHMPPWDAVRVLRDMTQSATSSDAPVAVAVHWGTFVTDPVEILKTLGQLEWACRQQGIRFGREIGDSSKDSNERSIFLALNHGQSVST